MIADDLTGALDAGVMFSNAGIRTCIDLGTGLPEGEDCRVLVKVAETRHVSPQTAYAQVRSLTEEAMPRGYSCIYKKTDSALRGNPGAELAAVLDGAAAPRIHFVPAFPKMNRVTRGGIQYIDGTIPLAESVFSSDPFNPVFHSGVRELLAATTEAETALANPDSPEGFTGIGIYDASTREDVRRIAPWNSPILSFEEDLLRDGWQMPIFAINGDLDHKMDVPRRSYSILFDRFIRLNGGTPQPSTHFLGAAADEIRTADNCYTPHRGYAQGHRLTTWVFRCDGVNMVCYTSVKDMPHGAIHDESRATWDFLRHFRRRQGHRRVHYTD